MLINEVYWLQYKLYWCPSDLTSYRKFPKYSDTQNSCCNHSKI